MKRIAPTLLAGLVLAGACGSSKDHNTQDISFAQDMIVHHRQVVEISTYAEAQGQSPKVKELAARLKGAQDPEIRTLQGWLSTWGAPETGTLARGENAGPEMDRRGEVVGDEAVALLNQITQLRAAAGADFDRMYLTLMTKVHERGTAIARAEAANGKNEPAKQLARTMVDTQQRDVAEMQGLLAAGP